MVKWYTPERLGGICAVLHGQWDFDPSDFPLGEKPPPVELDVSGVDYLAGGMAADEMAPEVAKAVLREAAAMSRCNAKTATRRADGNGSSGAPISVQ
jgi:hypothetical protein